jgi:hypothetical protein
VQVQVQVQSVSVLQSASLPLLLLSSGWVKDCISLALSHLARVRVSLSRSLPPVSHLARRHDGVVAALVALHAVGHRHGEQASHQRRAQPHRHPKPLHGGGAEGGRGAEGGGRRAAQDDRQDTVTSCGGGVQRCSGGGAAEGAVERETEVRRWTLLCLPPSTLTSHSPCCACRRPRSRLRRLSLSPLPPPAAPQRPAALASQCALEGCDCTCSLAVRCVGWAGHSPAPWPPSS